MSKDENDKLTPRLMDVLREHDRLTNWFERSVKLIISIPLYINAGAVIALATFFSNNGSPVSSIKHATVSFVVGTVLGIFTLIFEYLTPLFWWVIYRQSFRIEGDLASLANRHEEYKSGCITKIMKTIYLRMMNGVISIVCCFLGIFFIAEFIIGNSWHVITWSIALFVYFIFFISGLLLIIKSG